MTISYKKELEIDQYALETEWLSIPSQILRYSTLFAQAIFDRDQAKEALEIVRAEMDRIVRMESMERGEKITEALVSSKIQLSPEYIEATKKVHEADYNVNVLRGAVNAFQAKKTALENLVRLFGMKYYSEPSEGTRGITQIAMDKGREEHDQMLEGLVPAPTVRPRK